MDFLRGTVRGHGYRLLCFSARGGETPIGNPDEWRILDREHVKRRFRDRDADVPLCIDAAAEGLNFQFCSRLINYDMQCNPMRVEQRTGRIDRVGQRHATIRVVNLHYERTVETAVYGTLRDRIGQLEQVAGRLPPILARMPRAVADAVLACGDSPDAQSIADRDQETVSIEGTGRIRHRRRARRESRHAGSRPVPVTLDGLDRALGDPNLMPPGTDVPLGQHGLQERPHARTGESTERALG